jgi:hypothetical protein
MSNSPKLLSDVTSKEATKPFQSHLNLTQFGLFISMPNSWTPVSQGEMSFTPITDILSLHVACILSLCFIWETLWRDHMVTGNAAITMEPPCVPHHLATP